MEIQCLEFEIYRQGVNKVILEGNEWRNSFGH